MEILQLAVMVCAGLLLLAVRCTQFCRFAKAKSRGADGVRYRAGNLGAAPAASA